MRTDRLVGHSCSVRVPQTLRTRTILVVDDDLGTLETAAHIVRKLGFEPATASSGRDGLTVARASSPALGVIDLRLPDMSGTDVIRALRSIDADLPLILISGFMTVPDAVEAMRLGARDVIEKPISVEDLEVRIAGALDLPSPGQPLDIPASATRWLADESIAQGGRGARPTSTAERWARLVLRACQSEGDLRTLEHWAEFASVSYSSLCETCRLLNIQPQNARDLARVLRALLHAQRDAWDVAPLLDVSDGRTLRGILHRAGLDSAPPGSAMTLDRFFESQRFVDPANEGLRKLRLLLAGSES
jgi:ActR/RegA family two-component response regulator